MNKRMNPARPALPSGMVAVDKGVMREVVVGILTGNRIPAIGFDVDGYAPNHYRMLPYGQFGLIVGSKNAVEVRVLLDGKLLLEKQLYPASTPKSAGIDQQVRSMMSERPHPFFLMEANDGKPFLFNAHNPDLTLAQIVSEQIHAGAGSTPPTIDKLDRGVAATTEFKTDLDLQTLPDWLKKMMPPQPPTDATVTGAASTGAALANAVTEQPAVTTAGETAGAETANAVTAEPAVEAAVQSPLAPTVDVAQRSLTWAPSHGLVAIGVRMIQEVQEMEPPRGPDAFTYVLFQLNPWNIHNLVHARLMGRVIMPSRELMRKLMEDEGFGSDAPQVPKVVCGTNCGHKHHGKGR